MAVDEGRGDERAGEVGHRRVGKLRAADVVAAEPGDDAVTHRHRGRVGHGRAVHPAVEQQRGRHFRVSGRFDAWLVDVDDLDDLAVDVVTRPGRGE